MLLITFDNKLQLQFFNTKISGMGDSGSSPDSFRGSVKSDCFHGNAKTLFAFSLSQVFTEVF